MCVSKRTGKVLSSFRSFDEALDCVKYERSEHGLDLYPYKCNDCGQYHLSPRNRMIDVVENACSCTDSCKHSKKLYASYEDALKASKIILKERGIRVGIYKCPERSGYHLTHKSRI